MTNQDPFYGANQTPSDRPIGGLTPDYLRNASVNSPLFAQGVLGGNRELTPEEAEMLRQAAANGDVMSAVALLNRAYKTNPTEAITGTPNAIPIQPNQFSFFASPASAGLGTGRAPVGNASNPFTFFLPGLERRAQTGTLRPEDMEAYRVAVDAMQQELNMRRTLAARLTTQVANLQARLKVLSPDVPAYAKLQDQIDNLSEQLAIATARVTEIAGTGANGAGGSLGAFSTMFGDLVGQNEEVQKSESAGAERAVTRSAGTQLQATQAQQSSQQAQALAQALAPMGFTLPPGVLANLTPDLVLLLFQIMQQRQQVRAPLSISYQ